jgi:hypothetical protein
MAEIGPGDVVVCVRPPRSQRTVCQILTVGARYVVRKVYRASIDIDTGEKTAGFLLRGIINPKNERGQEIGYDIRRFRPIDERDAEIFRQMIADTKHFKVRAHHG